MMMSKSKSKSKSKNGNGLEGLPYLSTIPDPMLM
jgi:hypothetical protein